MQPSERVAALAEELQRRNLDAVFLGTGAELRYLTGVHTGICERLKGVFVLADGRVFGITPPVYYEEFRNQLSQEYPLYVWEDATGFRPLVRDLFRTYRLETGRLGINADVPGVDVLEMQEEGALELVSARGILDFLRLRKSAEELQLLRKALEITENALKEALTLVKPGVTEGELRRFLLRYFEEAGAEGPSFDLNVSRGVHTAVPHYFGTSGILESPDIIRFDIGCRYGGYCADLGRTFFVGSPGEEERQIFHTVRRALEAGQEAVRPGVAAHEVDRAAREVIEKAGYGKYFNHRLGHGLGMGVHEAPDIAPGKERLLEEGMVFTVEPSILL
ncbi:MAG TPA: Xaa-Pro peptidase family protein, partial [Synergistaceae bacterium]|nr:Xaa-Pro peptidase family protein [Synergistaceae bacterium]